MQLTLDTSWWTRYRNRDSNPDLDPNFMFPQAVPSLHVEQHTAIPRTDNDLNHPKFLQAIANTAGFHFPTIEQGGNSLYPSMAQRATSVEVLAHPDQHRTDRDHAFPDLAGQGGQCASSDGR